MHKEVYRAFEKICSKFDIRGRVLEVGAIPEKLSLLNMPCLKHASEKTGINLEGSYKYKDFSIVKGNANLMDCFSGGQFDAVLCNSVLEHDKYFWKTVSEIKRVTGTGGLIVIGAPGFTKFHTVPLSGAAAVLAVHNFPGDYYRFSPQAFMEVIFEGLKDVRVISVMSVPRIIGYGIKP
ncbi:MAG: methyltransferase domain-containing protein [Candidatus Omnitrophota bacterium]